MPEGKVAVDSARLRTEMLKDLLARSAAVMGAPMVPLACESQCQSSQGEPRAPIVATYTHNNDLLDWLGRHF